MISVSDIEDSAVMSDSNITTEMLQEINFNINDTRDRSSSNDLSIKKEVLGFGLMSQSIVEAGCKRR